MNNPSFDSNLHDRVKRHLAGHSDVVIAQGYIGRDPNANAGLQAIQQVEYLHVAPTKRINSYNALREFMADVLPFEPQLSRPHYGCEGEEWFYDAVHAAYDRWVGTVALEPHGIVRSLDGPATLMIYDRLIVCGYPMIQLLARKEQSHNTRISIFKLVPAVKPKFLRGVKQ